MSSASSNLEIQGNFMRVPPPKDASRALERRRSSEESQKPIPRRSITQTIRSTVNTPSLKKVTATSPMKMDTRQSMNKTDETEAMKTKIGNLEDEIRRLKRRIEELEKEIAELQKQVKTKEKRINELTKENEELKKRVGKFFPIKHQSFGSSRNIIIINKSKNFDRKILGSHVTMNIYKLK